MTIAEFESQCSVDFVELEYGYIVALTHVPTGLTMAGIGAAVSPTAADLAPELAKRVVNHSRILPDGTEA